VADFLLSDLEGAFAFLSPEPDRDLFPEPTATGIQSGLIHLHTLVPKVFGQRNETRHLFMHGIKMVPALNV